MTNDPKPYLTSQNHGTCGCGRSCRCGDACTCNTDRRCSDACTCAS